MATTIDSLQLEIQSNSNNAAASIDSLAKALKKLNKNSDINGAVTSLNNLRKSLHAFVNMPSNASKIESLAKSLKSLSKIKKIDLGDSLASVKRSMESLGAIDVDGVAPQIERIASALGPLSNVKGSGFNSMMNGLKKIGEITASLDEGTITAFVAKVKELDEKLGPLSTKMFAVSNAFNVVNSSAKTAGGGFKSFNSDISVSALNLTNFIDVAKSAYAALQPVINLFKNTISQAIEWEGISARFGRGFGDQAEEVYSWIQRLNREMGINTQQFMQYSSVFSTMLQGFGVNSGDSSKMALGYTELVYDIWAGYNDVYKNFSDAAEAIKSAIAGEVEPIRRAGFTIVESTLEQTAANHGLEISLEKATEAQKSYLRYLTLVDQAHAQNLVGTYAAEMGTAEGMVRTLSQQLKSLAQTFGSVFLPVLVKIMPWIQAFVSLINDAIIAVASFFGVTIQPVSFGKAKSGIDGVAESAGAAGGALGSAAKAAKELKNATIGIDELNVISPPDDTGSGSAGGGAASDFDWDVDSLWDESIFDNIQSQVETIKEKIKGLIPIAGGIAAAFTGWNLLKLLTDLDDAGIKIGKLEPTVKNLAKGLMIAGISVAVGKLVWDFTGAYLENGNLGDLAKALGTTVLGTALAAWLAGPMGAGIVLTTSGIVSLARLSVELENGNVKISDPEAMITALTGSLETLLGGALIIDTIRGGKWTKAIGTAISDGLMKAFGGTSFAWITSSLKAKLLTALSSVGTAIAGVSGWAIAAIAVVAGALLLAIVDYDFTDIGYKIGKALGKACRVVVDLAKEIAAPIWDGMKAAFDWCKENITWENVKSFVGALFKKETWTEIIWPKVKEIGKSIWDGLWKGVTDGLKNLGGNIKEFVNGFIKGFKDGFEIKSPSKKMATIGKDILAGLVSPLTPTALKDKFSKMWTEAKSWWDTKKGTLSTYTPSIGDIKAKLSSAWTTARNWWTRSKASLATYTPSIGSIKDRLVSAWNTAKAWWNSNVKLSIPSLSFKITYTTKGLSGIQRAVVNALGLAGWPKLSFAKNGGMFDMGSLIWAGEAGAEIVANAGGGKTGVMNVDQMQNAVYEGVYSAFVAAMRANTGDGGQTVNVYLDGKRITSAVEKRQRERGATVVRNGVYAY